MFRHRARYQKIFICTAVIVILYFVVIFVLRQLEHGSDVVPANNKRISKYDGQNAACIFANRKLDCGQKYGIEMFNEWKSTKFEICTDESTSKITCYIRCDEAVTRRTCLLINTKVRLYEPHYVANTSDLSSSAVVHMRNDIVSADCEPVALKYNGKNERRLWFDSLFRVDEFKASRTLDLHCKHNISHTVYWLWRWDATNAYHFLEDVTNTFSTLTLFEEDSDQVEIAIYDGMMGIRNNPLFTLWSELFPKGVRIIRENPFPRDTCFRRSITSPFGMRSHFTEFGGFRTDTNCSSPTLKGFREWANKKLHIERAVPVQRLTLLFVSRKQYLPTRNITRVLANEDVIIETIKSTFPSLDVIKFSPENYKTFKEQAEIANQGNIMVGVHGAGLVYSLFMSPGSHLVEIFMDDRTPGNRHFHNIATWMDVKYHFIDIKKKIAPPEIIVKLVTEAVKDLGAQRDIWE